MSQKYNDERYEINCIPNIMHQIYENEREQNGTRFTFYLDYTIHATLCAATVYSRMEQL